MIAFPPQEFLLRLLRNSCVILNMKKGGKFNGLLNLMAMWFINR